MTTTTIAAGQRSGVHTIAPGVVVTVTPAAGASAIVEYTASAASDITNNVATWKTWPNGTVTSLSAALCNKRGFVRATAIGGAVVLDTNFGPTNEQLAPYETDWGGLLGVSGGGVGLKSAGVLAQSAVPASVTGTVAETVLATVAIPAMAAGVAGGKIRITVDTTQTANADAKTVRLRLAGSQIWGGSSIFLSTSGSKFAAEVWIVGSNSQKTMANITTTYGGAATGAMVTSAVDMTQPQNLTITGQLATSTDSLQIEGYTVEILNP